MRTFLSVLVAWAVASAAVGPIFARFFVKRFMEWIA